MSIRLFAVLQAAWYRSKEYADQLNAGIFPVTPFQQNCTILFDTDDKTGVVVDPGGEIDQILKVLDDRAIAASAIWLTHGHIDHAGGAMELKERLGVEISGRTRQTARCSPIWRTRRWALVSPTRSATAFPTAF